MHKRQDLDRDTALGVQTKHCNCYNAFVDELKNQKLSASEKINSGYHYVRNAIKWNGEDGLKAEIPIDSVYKYKTGTAAEINLSLICLLKKAGIDAKPLISSTVDHGLIRRSVPAEKWFNYTTALVHAGGNQYIIDAADPWNNPYLVPPYLINGYGKVIDTAENSWIEMSPNGLFQNQSNYNLMLEPTKGLTGKFQSRDIQYAAYIKRKSLQDSIQENNYFEDLNYRYPAILSLIHIFPSMIRLAGYNSRPRFKYEMASLYSLCSIKFQPILLNLSLIHIFFWRWCL